MIYIMHLLYNLLYNIYIMLYILYILHTYIYINLSIYTYIYINIYIYTHTDTHTYIPIYMCIYVGKVLWLLKNYEKVIKWEETEHYGDEIPALTISSTFASLLYKRDWKTFWEQLFCYRISISGAFSNVQG